MSVTEKCKSQIAMFDEKSRLETFKNWHFADDKSCSRLKLAEAGFCFIGTSNEPDAVECFFCRKALDGWDEADDPWLEHQKHSINCDFAKLGKPEGDLTVNQLIDFKKKFLNLILTNSIKEIKTIFANKKIEMVNSLYNPLGVKKR